MRSSFVLPSIFLLTLAACGDKLDPGEATDSGSGSSTSSTQGGDGNTTASNGNTPAGNSNSPATGSGLCGTSSSTITYNGQAALVINNRCAVCHSSATRGQSPDMSNYTNAKSGISGGGLGQIKSGSMPPAGSTALSVNESCIIGTWASQGYQN